MCVYYYYYIHTYIHTYIFTHILAYIAAVPDATSLGAETGVSGHFNVRHRHRSGSFVSLFFFLNYLIMKRLTYEIY